MHIILLDGFGPVVGLALLFAIVLTFVAAILSTFVKGKNVFYKKLALIIGAVAIFCIIMRYMLFTLGPT